MRGARRGLVRSARALAAAALLALSGALVLPTTAQAQESGTLVSNIGQGSTLTTNRSIQSAQRFTTGSYEHGYTLSTVDVVSADAEGDSFEAQVCTVDGDGHPTSTCTDLAAPGSPAFAAGTITFYAPAYTVLEPETTYTVLLTTPKVGGTVVTFGQTTADGEDAGLADGWSIADTFDSTSLNDGAWFTHTTGWAFRIAIKGSEAPEPETTENRPSEIRAYWNVPGHFGGNSMAGCAGTVPFRAFWERPKRADEWEAEVKPEYGASNLNLSSIEYIGDGFHELTGTVHVRDGEFGVVSIRVRGRFGDDGWGAWSRPTELFCVPPPPPRTLADGVKVTSSPASGDVYGPGETIEITVEFSSAVVVVGDPEFEFCMGNDECRTGTDPPARRRAAYSSGSGTTELVFSYVVGSDDDPDDDGNGIWIGDGTRTLQLDSDDRIRSAETDHNAEIEHNALGDQSDHKVDALADIDEIAVTSSPASGDTYDTGEIIEITVTFDLAVNVTGDPQFGISVAGEKLASFTRGSGTTELVFGYTVQFGDEDDNGIWIGSHDHDSNPTFRLDSDDAITGAETGHDADLAHDVIGQQNGHKVDGATATQGQAAHAEPQEDDEITALTASFEDQPGGHDGESAFTLRIAFSEAVAIDAPSVGVINGSVTGVRRVDGRDDLWEITVVPASNGVVFVSLLQPLNLACGEAGAICTADGRPLSASISAAVRGPDEGPPPLTASFEDLPAEHDGESAFTLRMAFSEPLSWMSGRRLREDVVAVAGGRATKAGRVNRRRDLWKLTVEPDSLADVTVTLAAGAACDSPAAVCTSDGRALSNTIATTVRGPVAVSVADARAEEGTDETIDFAVTLSREASGTVAVAYATADGSATAGEDYTRASGELRFAPGETEKTVSVPVLDDAVDEDEETLTLRLLNASGAAIADGMATGTIENSDPIPQAWLARFGRTVAGHVTDAIGERLTGPAGGGSHVTLGGQRLSLDGHAPDGADATRTEAADGLTAFTGRLAAHADGGARERREPGATRSLTGRELLLGSSFRLAPGGGAGTRWTAWGRAAQARFDGDADGLALDGDVTTFTLGADAAWSRWLAGVALAYSTGEGGYRDHAAQADDPDHPDRDAGTLESTLTSVHPYARYRAGERLTLWGMLGYGMGDLTLTMKGRNGAADTKTDTDTGFRMAAAGARGVLLSTKDTGGFELAARTDAQFVRMTSDKADGLAATTAETSRLRLVLEGSHRIELAGGQTLTPTLEVGLRHDGGDAETGAGIEVGGGLRYADPALGLTVEAKARTLVAHADSGYREWGASGSVRIDPGASGRGLSLTLAPAWGAASGGADRLWSLRDARQFAANDAFEPAGRLDAEAGYGFGAFGGRGLMTPYAGLALSETGARAWRTGVRWTLGPGVAFGVEGTRSEPANDDAPAHGLAFRATLRW